MSAVQELVETLVRVVARAFYRDEVVVVVDALVRDSYLRDDLLGPAMGLKTKQVRKVIVELQRDDLVCDELVSEWVYNQEKPDKPIQFNKRYWYIDYAHFVDVLRLRLKLMQKELRQSERRETEQMKFRCLVCGTEFTHLEAMSCMSATGAFQCRNCGSTELKQEGDARAAQVQTHTKLERLREQLRGEPQRRAGIEELVKKLEGEKIGHNLPSENRRHGVGRFMRGADDPTSSAPAGGLQAGGQGSGGPGGAVGNRVDEQELLFGKNALGQHVQVSLEDGAADRGAATSGGGDGRAGDDAGGDGRGARTVEGDSVQEAYQAALLAALQQHRQQQAAMAPPDVLPLVARAGTEQEAGPSIGSQASGDMDDDEEDDWEEAA